MKKLSFLLCMFLSVNMYAQVADFEEAAITPAEANSEYLMDSTGTFTSGVCAFGQYVDALYAPAIYYYGFVVSNHTDTVFESYEDAYQVVGGQAHSGNNYAVWYSSWYGNDRVSVAEPTQFAGFYVNNSTYVEACIVDGFGLTDGAFTAEDWLKLTIYGLNGTDTTGAVDFYLAKDSSYVREWTWVDLSTLGEVTDLAFDMTGSRNNSYGPEVATYFCMDDLTIEEDIEPATYFIKNNWNGGNWTWQEMTLEEDGITYSYQGVFGGTGVNINTEADDSEALWFPIDQWHFTALGYEPAAGDEILFEYDSQESTITATFKGKSGLDTITIKSENNSLKVMMNGQLYIIRDGKTYNACGVEM